MSNLEENSFQLARYLLEFPSQGSQVEIRDALGFSDQDFRLALKFLVDDECCSTAGQFGTGIIYTRNSKRLQQFVNGVQENRANLSRTEEVFLKFLYENETLAKEKILDLGWDEKQISNICSSLKSDGLIDVQYAGDEPYDFWITNEGKKLVRNNFRVRSNPVSVNIGDNSIVNIGSTLVTSNQVLYAACISSTEQQEIADLIKKLDDALAHVPPQKSDEAEVVAQMAKSLVENAVKEKPNKPYVEYLMDGLAKAAENLGNIVPPVLTISQSVIVCKWGLKPLPLGRLF